MYNMSVENKVGAYNSMLKLKYRSQLNYGSKIHTNSADERERHNVANLQLYMLRSRRASGREDGGLTMRLDNVASGR